VFRTVLIANRGAIACRIQRTLRRLGIRSVAVYSEADRHARHVNEADAAALIGPAAAADSYLRADRILEAARATGAEAIHPGYGFLSENADFAAACESAGLAFIGPTPAQMRDFGLKHTARALAQRCGLPLLPGSGLLDDLPAAQAAARTIGYPVMLKSTAGGGGIGMQPCADDTALEAGFAAVRRLAGSNFGQSGVFLEKLVTRARHIEVQIFGDGHGGVLALGERDCSIQRRNQKVIEETPAPQLDDTVRAQLLAAAVTLARAVRYRSAGTVEFIYDASAREFYFLEVNTRLQVEHGVTEAVTGIDLVEWMIRLAAGEPPDLAHRPLPQGHAIQARLYAEDPARQFRPSSGLLSHVQLPQGLRVDSWIESGTEVSAYYDPMLAKFIAHAPTRAAAVAQLDRALAETTVYGIETNQEYLRCVLHHPTFAAGLSSTRLLSDVHYQPRSIEVLAAGTHTTVQDWPGRTGYWDVGVPPSGPMDALAFRLANRIVGNDPDCAGLELTATGPTLRFSANTIIALTGAHMPATLDGTALPYWCAVPIAAGSVLKVGSIEGGGQRTYFTVLGGFDLPAYMGSRSTFTLGQFGGHAGRAVRTGDVLRLRATAPTAPALSLAADARPRYGHQWRIAVLIGPHAAPDYFTPADIDAFFAADWEVHYNSSRTGVRLVGPVPQWARRDGGEAGLHPSNIHDNAYAIGAIDFTGDMPVILGPDGPSLGGFVCPATIALADLWQIGQLRPGDRVRFHVIEADEARERLAAQDAFIATLGAVPVQPTAMESLPQVSAAHAARQHGAARSSDAVLARRAARGSAPAVCYRQSGEDNVLVEYGEPTLDLELRFRVQALLARLHAKRDVTLLDLTPGIRSLQVHFDPRRSSRDAILTTLQRAEEQLPDVDQIEVPSRIVHLPLSWDDPTTRQAIERYMQSVRPDAPWCPSNIEFIRRINGLDSVDDVRRIVFDARYLVMGLGDVYLGAPVATPLDPRHRLVTTKYNPARTWTPENAVGIGGAYLCVYGMEGPGGYQFVGRTLQMWNRYRQTTEFRDDHQWLLRFFDQLQFYPVSAAELLAMRDAFPYGKVPLRIEPVTLRLRDYRDFLRTHADSIATFKARQQAAFEAERERWVAAGVASESAVAEPPASAQPQEIPEGCMGIAAPVTGSIWKLHAAAGRVVRPGEPLVVIEAMKMEIAVQAEQPGVITELRCATGAAVRAGDTLLVLRPC
jgi:urea carboxylase